MKHPIPFVDIMINIVLVTSLALARAQMTKQSGAQQEQKQDGDSSGLAGDTEIAVQVFEDGILCNGQRYTKAADLIPRLPAAGGKHLVLSVTGGNHTVTDRTVGAVARDLWTLLQHSGTDVTRY